MRFTKMQGLGNDYVYVDCTKEELKNPADTARQVSDRHFGVGSDGLILIKKSENADFFMEMYNADGSRGEMCGNGIRCVGKFVFDKGLTTKRELTIDTLAGVKTLWLTVENGEVLQVKVDMGAPILKASLIPIQSEEELFLNQTVVVEGESFQLTGVSMGNPHAITFVKDVAAIDLPKWGPKFENHLLFPRRINTEFVEVLREDYCKMRVWERGAGETLACGTGACAVVVAGVLNGLLQPQCEVELLGGNLLVEWNRELNTVFMTGPAKVVFEGEILNQPLQQ